MNQTLLSESSTDARACSMSPGRLTRALDSIAACSLVLLLSGCATPQVDALLQQRPAQLPVSHSLDVPYFAQKDHQCGPAALAMALDAAGDTVTPPDLVGSVFIPAREGSLPPEMLAAARRRSRLAVELDPKIDAVLAEVAAGTPVIVLQNLSLPILPIWHYSVVVGYDLQHRDIILQSGGQQASRLALRTFERTWARSNRWAMVVLPPDRLPVSQQPAQIFAAAVTLERSDPAAARRTYRAMTQRFPNFAQAWIGLGNVAYTQGDLGESAAGFRKATEIDPGSADAWNNLASALAALGRRCEAAQAVRHAIQIGGPRLAQYRQTANEIDATVCDNEGLR
jgi:Peptidase_C39 like family/Tetratricopeptide repeat